VEQWVAIFSKYVYLSEKNRFRLKLQSQNMQINKLNINIFICLFEKVGIRQEWESDMSGNQTRLCLIPTFSKFIYSSSTGLEHSFGG